MSPSATVDAPAGAARAAALGPISVMNVVTTFGAGGTERQFVTLGLGLDSSRFNVSFACLRQWGRFLDEVQARAIPVFEYPVTSFRSPRALAAVLRLARDLRRRNVQVVHAYNFYANVFAVPAARLAGVPVIASIRDLGLYLTPGQRHFQRHVLRFADRIVVNAAAIRDWLVGDGYDADRISIIPNGIDLARFGNIAPTGWLHAEMGFPSGAPIIGVLSRVIKQKGLEDFIDAAAMVAPRFPHARFLIVGDGYTSGSDHAFVKDEPYHRELEERIQARGLVDRVFFTGFRPDVERVLAELSISVLPSHSEGLSNAVLESMAAGLPVVATRVGGTGEALQDDLNGVLVPPKDPAALAGGLCLLLARPAVAERLARAARTRIEQHFSMSRLVEATSRLYEAVATRRRPEA